MTGCCCLRLFVADSAAGLAVDEVGMLDVVTVASAAGASLLGRENDTGFRCFRFILRGGEDPQLLWPACCCNGGDDDIFLAQLALAIFESTVSWKGGDGLGLDLGVS